MKFGLEIHQRLDTNKLFCNCPSILVDDQKEDFKFTRMLHPVVSEIGEIDRAAKSEFQKQLLFEYNVHKISNCLVETDEEPPHNIDLDALNIALEVSNHLNAKIVDEFHIMRKLVIDGSNTSGFQRTGVLSMDGFLETSKGKVGIATIAIEEESSGIIKRDENKANYRLDRLGIPLIEIATDPDIKDPDHLKEVAQKIGSILRQTGKVMRGLGTIRQDVNVSIEGGARVEIKGAQDLKMLPTIAQNEVNRQQGLLKIYSEIKRKFGAKFKLKFNSCDLSSLFKSTESKIISSGLSKGSVVVGMNLKNYSGLLGVEIQKGRRFGSELSDYAKPAGVRGIIHSDEDLSKYKISEKEISKIKEKLKVDENDAFVLVVAPIEIAKNALKLAFERAITLEVLEETRKVNKDGTTSYMRPLPGRARMYPETDVESVEMTKQYIDSVKASMSKSLDEKQKELEKILNKELAKKMLKSKQLKLFEKLVGLGHDPMLVATTLENTLIQIRRMGIEFLNLEKVLVDLFTEYKKDRFVKGAIQDVLLGLAKGFSFDEVLDKFNLHKIKGKELEKIAKENNFNIGEIMRKYRLRIDPKDVGKLKKS